MSTGRDGNGRFLPGHPFASKGGKARAKKLPAWRRKAIAIQGYWAMVRKHFDGNPAAANAWLAKAGQHAQDAAAREGGWLFQFPDPGPHPAHRNGRCDIQPESEQEFPDSWY
jgi:hypothetical protein